MSSVSDFIAWKINVFIGYNEDKDNSNNKGYKLIAAGIYTTDAEGDKLFSIVPCGAGYSLSAQGKYLQSPTLSKWNHIMFSDNKSEAGAYLFEEVGIASVFKMRSTGEGINYVNDYDKGVFGNDKSDKENLATFTMEKVDAYSLIVPESGIAVLCLPFHVVMPEGMCAYDLIASDVKVDETGKCFGTLKPVADSGETLKAGTPVVVVAEEGKYNLDITIGANIAHGALPGSLLRGNFVKEELAGGEFLFAAEMALYRMGEPTTMKPNQCWVELPSEMADVESVLLQLNDDVNAIGALNADEVEAAVYNIAGQRLVAPQKGYNIINGKKVIIK